MRIKLAVWPSLLVNSWAFILFMTSLLSSPYSDSFARKCAYAGWFCAGVGIPLLLIYLLGVYIDYISGKEGMRPYTAIAMFLCGVLLAVSGCIGAITVSLLHFADAVDTYAVYIKFFALISIMGCMVCFFTFLYTRNQVRKSRRS